MNRREFVKGVLAAAIAAQIPFTRDDGWRHISFVRNAHDLQTYVDGYRVPTLEGYVEFEEDLLTVDFSLGSSSNGLFISDVRGFNLGEDDFTIEAWVKEVA